MSNDPDRPKGRRRADPLDQDKRAREDADSLRLVEAIKRGEYDLIDVLYTRYFDALYGYLSSLLDAPADAEDAIQEAWEDVIEGLPTYEVRHAASFRSWLFAIARNRAADQQRKHGRVELTAPHEMREQMARLPSDLCEPQESLSWVSDGDLMAALRRLPSMPREVVVLRYVADFDLAEIAEVMSVSESSVKQAHRRALRALRQRLSILVGQEPGRRRPLAMRQLTWSGSRICAHSFSPVRT